jgi:Ion channel
VLSALLLGTGVLLVGLLLYAAAVAVIVGFVVRVIRTGYAGQSFWKNIAIMILVTLVTAAAHLTEIALWAGAFVICGQISTFEDAFYFSAQNYTALRYGDIVLPGRWRLLGPLEAINGLLLFGLSTAAMFAVLSRLIASHFPAQHAGDVKSAGNC